MANPETAGVSNGCDSKDDRILTVVIVAIVIIVAVNLTVVLVCCLKYKTRTKNCCRPDGDLDQAMPSEDTDGETSLPDDQEEEDGDSLPGEALTRMPISRNGCTPLPGTNTVRSRHTS